MKTKILIVDDSRIFRSAVEAGLSREKDIEVIGSVWNGIKALEFLETNDPDIITLDIQMPDMGGIETLEAIKEINAKRPAGKQIGIIMLSSLTEKGADITIKALQMGAYDFITKPAGRDITENLNVLCSQLVVKIRNYMASYAPGTKRNKTTPTPSKARIKAKTEFRGTCYPPVVKAILIGVSTGGPKALAEFLPPLCEGIDIPILVVQHMPPTFTESLARSLNAKCSYTVVEAKHDTSVQGKHVYIAPGGRHMVLEKQGRDIKIMINDQAPEKGCRPSVDKLFRTGAEIYRQHVIGVILTGMGTDGTSGGIELKNYGAPILIQDEQSSVVWGMPGSANAAGIVDVIQPLKDLPGTIIKMLH